VSFDGSFIYSYLKRIEPKPYKIGWFKLIDTTWSSAVLEAVRGSCSAVHYLLTGITKFFALLIWFDM
jgi:hypothetical protein